MIDPHDAACCLLHAVDHVIEEYALPEVHHHYLTAAGTWPYCGHDAVIVTQRDPTTQGPDPVSEYDAPAERQAVWFDRFDVTLLRAGPPLPDNDSCLIGLYGDCESPMDASTLSGHHRLVSFERGALRSDLLEHWCDCMEPARSKTQAAWIEGIELVHEGRYSGTTFTVAALLG